MNEAVKKIQFGAHDNNTPAHFLFYSNKILFISHPRGSSLLEKKYTIEDILLFSNCTHEQLCVRTQLILT